MRVKKCLSFAAAAVAAASAVIALPASPASAVPAGADVMVAVPTSGLVALPITCIAHAGSEEDADLSSVRYYGAVECTGPVGISAQAELWSGFPVKYEAEAPAISCTCASGTSEATFDTGVLLLTTRFRGTLTAPSGYQWDTGGTTRGFAIDATYLSYQE